MFMKLIKYGHENPGGAKELNTKQILMKTKISEVVPGSSDRPSGSSKLATGAPYLASIAFSHDLSSLVLNILAC